MTNENISDLIKENKDEELLSVIDEHIKLIKKDLHDEMNGGSDNIEEAYKLATRSGRIATIISRNARKSNKRYLFEGGYLAALVDEYRKNIDNRQRINAFDTVYKTNINKAHWKDILALLYKKGMMQNKEIIKETGVSASHLNKIMSNMIAENCVTFYEFSKYKYYSLAWMFRKYLDSIGFEINNDNKVNVFIEVHPKVNTNREYYESVEQWTETYIKTYKKFALKYHLEKYAPDNIFADNVKDYHYLQFGLPEKNKGKEVISGRCKSRRSIHHRRINEDNQAFSEAFEILHRNKELQGAAWKL